MFENNNKAIVRKIIKRALRSDKRRNFFIIAAIMLTAFMITSVFSVGISYYETITVIPLRSEGMKTHAGIADPNAERLEVLRSLDYVRRISIGYRVGMEYKDGAASGIGIVAVNEESWKYFQTPAFTDIVGKFAKAENEIMLSRALLEHMGINDPYIGMEITIDFAIGDFYTGEFGDKQSEAFILSAIFTEYVSTSPGQAHTPIFVSEAFAERHGRKNIENANINIIFTNQNRAVEFSKRLAQDLNLDYDTQVGVHPSLEKQADRGSSTMYIAIGIIVAFFMFVGFLLIYNVMYVSVSKDVRFYGLLKTMGTTPKQLRNIVNGQVLMMYLIGLPIGLALTVVTSFAVVPAFITGSRTGTVVSFSPLIYISGAVFALITAYLGASISAKKAAKVSPIEAIRYTGEQNVNFTPRSTAKGKPSRMAWRNMFRERKRAFIVLVSLFLGITVFTGAMSIVNSTDIAGNIEYWYDHDISINTFNAGVSDLGMLGIERDFINEIVNIPGVSEVREQTSGIATFEYPPEVETANVEQNGYFNPILAITGIDRAYMEEINNKLENPIDIEAFERGEIALVDESKSLRPMGDMLYKYFYIGAELYFEIGLQSRIPVNTKIAGYTEIHNMTEHGVFTGGDLTLIMSNAFLESISGKAGINALGINIEDGMEELVNDTISAMIEGRDMAMASILKARREQEAARLTLFVLGSTISGILALIGIFNFINLISVGLITRKREFAALESVGMSKKQMRLMLRWEGAIYWIFTITASITAGTGFAYGLFCLVQNQDPSLFPQFIYPIVPVAVVFSLIVLICTVTPEICYRGISKNTLVERLREVE
jgi:putative ABC transport system permease protein